MKTFDDVVDEEFEEIDEEEIVEDELENELDEEEIEESIEEEIEEKPKKKDKKEYAIEKEKRKNKALKEKLAKLEQREAERKEQEEKRLKQLRYEEQGYSVEEAKDKAQKESELETLRNEVKFIKYQSKIAKASELFDEVIEENNKGINEGGHREIKKGCNMNFWKYCIEKDEKYFSGRPYLKEIADEIEKGKHTVITLPPRAGKSYLMTMYSMWVNKKVLRVSFSKSMALNLSEDLREYGSFNVTNISVYETPIGHDYDILIFDDVIKYDDNIIDILEINRWCVKVIEHINKGGQVISINSKMGLMDIGDIMLSVHKCKWLHYSSLVDGKSFCEEWNTTEDLKHEQLIDKRYDFETIYQGDPYTGYIKRCKHK